MPNRRDDAPTQPLPLPGHPRERRPPFRRLATLCAASWASGVILVAGQYTAAAARAPRLVRGMAWSTACLCLTVAATCLACCAALAIASAAVHLARAADTRRRILHAGAAPALADGRERLRSLAEQAALGPLPAGDALPGRVLHMADATRSGRRDRYGA